MPMDLDETDFRILKALNKKQQAKVFGMADVPGTTFEQPEYKKARGNFDETSGWIRDYEDEHRPADEQGKLTADAPSAQPVRNFEPDDFSSKQPSNYFYEPSVDEARHRLETDPDFAKRLGLERYMRELEPQHPTPIHGLPDPAFGQSVHMGVQQPRTHLEGMTSNTPDYKAVADEMWRERSEEGKARGRNLTRYSKVKLGDSPVDYLAGGAEKIWEQVVTPTALEIGDNFTLGTGRAKQAQNRRDAIAARANGEQAVVPPDVDAEAIERQNPFVSQVARYGSYAMPSSPANVGTNIMLDAMSYATTKNPFARGLIGAFAGGTVNAAESYAHDLSRGHEAGVPVEQNLREAANNTPENFATGGLYSLPFEAGAEMSRAFRKSVREAPSNIDLKALRNARGDTAVGAGYVAPKEIREDIEAAAADRHLGTAGDVAARRVAPQIQESLDTQLAGARKSQGEKNEEYFAHPAYKDRVESSQEAVDAVMELAERGWVEGAISGKRQNVDQKKLRRIGEALHGVHEKKDFVNKVQAEAYAQKHGGKVIDGDMAAAMFPSDKVNPKRYVLIAASPMNASSLTQLERRIDEMLNESNVKGAKEDPVYERFQRSIKDVRDKFPYYVDENDNLVSPPGWQPAPTSSQMPAPPTRSRRASKRPSQQAPATSAAASTQPASTSPGMPPTPKQPSELDPGDFTLDEPSEIGSAEARALPPSTTRGEAPQQPPYGQWDFEEVRRRFPGLSDDEAHKIVNRLNGRDAEAVELGSDEFSPGTESIGPDDIHELPPSTNPGTDPEYTPRQPSALNPEDYSPEPSSIDTQDVTALPPGTDPEFTPRQPSTLESADIEQLPESIPSEDARALPPETEPHTRRSMAPPALSDDTPLARMAGTVTDEANPAVEEAAKRASHWIDAAFTGSDGPSSSERTKLIAKSVAHQLGRALNSDELKDVGKFVVPLVAGTALGDAVYDEDGSPLGAMAGGLIGGMGRGGRGAHGPPSGKPPSAGGKPPSSGSKPGFRPRVRELQVTLPDGTIRTGLSALRTQQHEQLSALHEAGAGLGADSDKSVLRKVLGFNQYSGTPEDKLLLEQAKKLGLEDDLFRAAATLSYGRLKERGLGGAAQGELRGGTRNILSRILGSRAEALTGILAGEPSMYQGKQGSLQKGAREILNIGGGRTGARFGNDTDFIRDYLNQLLFGSQEEPQQSKAGKDDAR